MYYRRKIAALLHDPIDKAVKYRGHVKRAKEYIEPFLEKLDEQEKDILWWIESHHKPDSKLKTPDIEASASNRVLIPKNSKEKELILIHPFSGKIVRPFPKRGIEDLLFEPLSFSPPSSTKNLYLQVWRNILNSYVVQDRYLSKFTFLLPEDSRTPYSPIISHLHMSSALTSLTSDTTLEGWMVRTDLGGIGDFIKVARKSSDLWAGSFIASLVSYSLIKWAIDAYGPDQIIYPFLYTPLTDYDLFSEQTGDITLPSIPNSSILLLPKKKNDKEIKKDDVKKKIKEKMGSYWEEITEACRRALEEKVGDLPPKTTRKWKEQVNHFPFKLRRIILELPSSYLTEYDSWKEIYEDFLSHQNCPRCVDSQIFDTLEHDNLRNKLLAYPDRRILERFHSIVQWSNKLLNGKKNLDLFSFKKVKQGERCGLCGRLQPLFERHNQRWKILEEEGIIDVDERLCSLCLTKRLFRDAFENILQKLFEGNTLKGVRRTYPSTTTFSTMWFRITLIGLLLVLYEEGREEDIKRANKIYSERVRKLQCIYDREGIWERVKKSTIQELKAQDLFKRLSGKLEGESTDNHANVLPMLPNSVLLPEEAFSIFKREGSEKAEEVRQKVKEFQKKLSDFLKELLMEKEIRAKMVEKLRSEIEDMLGLEEKEFKSLFGDISLLPLSYKPNSYYGLVAADGDSMGKKWFSGTALPSLGISLSPEARKKLAALFSNLPNNGKHIKEMFLRTPRPHSPASLSMLSMALTFMAVKIFKKIIDAFGGKVVYSGGDDLLTYLPAETTYLAIFLARLFFSRELSLEQVKGGETYIPGLGFKATLSAGIIVAHHKSHLGRVIEEAKNLEEASKQIISVEGETLELKDSLSVAFLARGGTLVKTKPIPWLLIEKEGKHFPIASFAKEVITGEGGKTNMEKYAEKYNKWVKRILSEFSREKLSRYYGIDPKSRFKSLKNSKIKAPFAWSPILEVLTSVKMVQDGTLSTRGIYDLLSYYRGKEAGLPTETNQKLLMHKLKRRINTSSKEKTKLVAKYFDKLLRTFRKVKYKQKHKDEELGLTEAILPIKTIRNVLANSLIGKEFEWCEK